MLFAVRNSLLILILILLAVPSSFADTWALLVGISDYQDLNIKDPRYAANDAKQFHNALIDRRICAAPQKKAYLMTDESNTANLPTSANVLSRLRDLVAQIEDPEDTLIFYFSGYATVCDGKQFLLSMDSDTSSTSTLSKSAITLEAIQSEFEKIEARQVVIILNVFYNNPENRAPQTLGRVDGESVLTDELVRGFKELRSRVHIDDSSRTATFFPSSVGERAYDWDEEKCSVFSFYLLEGLRGEAADSELLFSVDASGYQSDLDKGIISTGLRKKFRDEDNTLSGDANVLTQKEGSRWLIIDNHEEYLVREEEGKLNISENQVTLSGLADYMREQVVTWSRERGTRQTPWLDSSGTAKIVLAEPLRFGILEVEAVAKDQPIEAEVFLDDGQTGSTPLTIEKVKPGTHKVRVRAPLYHEYSRAMKIMEGDRLSLKVELRPAFGSLRVESTPSGAEVDLSSEKGVSVARGITPFSLDKLPSGDYKLSVSKDRYYTESRNISIDDDKEEARSFKLRPKFGILEVESEPQGALVSLEREGGQEKKEGITPVKWEPDPGNYILRLQHEFYSHEPQQVEIQEGSDIVIRETLTPNFGTLDVHVTPDNSRVYVDEKPMGRTPAEGLRLTPGKHLVRVVSDAENLAPLEKSVLIRLNRTESLTGRLVWKEVTLLVTSDPPGAHITISEPSEVHFTDDQDYGVTPKSLYLPASTYILRLSKQGFLHHKERIQIDYEKEIELKIPMSPTRFRMASLSLLTPGLGQYTGKRHISGTAFFLAGLGAAATTAVSYYQYSAAVSSYKEAVAPYRRAFADGEIEKAEKEMEKAYDKAESKFKFRRVTPAVLACVWAANALHALIRGPSIKPASSYVQLVTPGLRIAPQTIPGTMGVLWYPF